MTARMGPVVSSTTLAGSLEIAQKLKTFSQLRQGSALRCEYPTAASLIHKHWCPCRDQARTEFIDKKASVAASMDVSVPL